MKNEKRQNSQEDIDNEEVNKNRRRFLTVLLIGGGAFLVEKILTPLFSGFLNDSLAKVSMPEVPDGVSFKGFQISEDKQSLFVYDSSGEEIFQIDKEA